MEWFKEHKRAYGFLDPIIAGREVHLCEVKQTLESRLASTYAVTYDSECRHVDIQAKRPEDRRVATVTVAPGDSGTTIQVTPQSRNARRFRRLLRSAPELRVGPIEPIDPAEYGGTKIPDSLVSLLSVYAGQFGSYTTLLWQVPALGLTAQSFLLTIALMKDTSGQARIVACALSTVIAVASVSLMHNQRGRAINHAELLRRLSAKLGLGGFLHGSVELEDAAPKQTNAQNVWAVDHLIYHGWMACMGLFAIADILIFFAAVFRPSLFGTAAAVP